MKGDFFIFTTDFYILVFPSGKRFYSIIFSAVYLRLSRFFKFNIGKIHRVSGRFNSDGDDRFVDLK